LLDDVGDRPNGASWIGAVDMCGNIWEWTHDFYADTYYASSPTVDPPGPPTAVDHSARGGYWGNTQRNLRVSVRAAGDELTGIRCARSL